MYDATQDHKWILADMGLVVNGMLFFSFHQGQHDEGSSTVALLTICAERDILAAVF
jgi:hypothetical protein